MNSILLPSELRNAPASIDMLVAGTVPAYGVGVLWGETGVGKTAVAMDMALRIAAGRSYHGRATAPARVLYCIAEGAAGLPQRLFAACEHLDIEPESLDPYVGFRTTPTDLSLPDVRAMLTTELAEKGLSMPGLVVLDTYSTHTSSGFSENDTAHAKEMGDACRLIAASFRCLVLVIHHSGWNGDRLRGSSDLLGSVDVSLKLAKQGETARTLTVEKARDFAKPAPLHLAMRAKFGGVVMESASGMDHPLSPSQRRALRILSENSVNGPIRSSDWLRLSGAQKTQFYEIARELVGGGYAQRTAQGCSLTETGCAALGIPVGLRPDSGTHSDRSSETLRPDSRNTPVSPGPFRAGHRNPADNELFGTPSGVRADSGPGLEATPWDAFGVGQ